MYTPLNSLPLTLIYDSRYHLSPKNSILNHLVTEDIKITDYACVGDIIQVCYINLFAQKFY